MDPDHTRFAGEKKITNLAYDDISPRLKEIYPWARHNEAHASYMGNLSWWQYMENGIAAILASLGIPEKTAGEVAAEVHGEYLRPEKWRLYEDTIPVLEKAKSLGYRNIILSNHVPDLEGVMSSLGISLLFDAIFTSGAVGYEKPHREIFLHAIRGAGLPRYAIMVGDNFTADISGATAVGMQAVLVRKPNTFNYPHYAETLTGALRIIRNIFSITA